ncbi:MAG: type II secretion system protein N [Gallionella sp.]|nr:type II secretion system protein N [Gallionella sp.]
MRRKLWIAAGLYGIFLLITVPAHWAAVALAKFSHQRIQLIDPVGTLWQGKSSALQVDTHRLKEFAWTLNAGCALWATVCADVTWAGDSHAKVRVTRQTLQLQAAQITLPVAWLATAFPTAEPYGWGGDAIIQTSALTWQFDGGLKGIAHVEWRDAHTIKLLVQPLGDYLVEVTGTEQGVVLQLRTLRGALEVNGTGRWAAHDHFRFSGSVKPDPARQSEFTALLNLTGNQPDALGQYRVGF